MAEDSSRYLAAARNLAIDILRNESSRTPTKIHEVAVQVAKMMKAIDNEADAEELAAELRHLFSVEIDGATILDDEVAHVPWLLERKADIPWRFWARYMKYLERELGMPPSVVNALDDLTDAVLSRLENPQREGAWDTRGMVVGSVQSGKTANYVGLIGKAIDAGYKLVIVLAGIHSNLRSQTQVRIDEGVLGFDTQKSRRLNTHGQWIGVGRYSDPGAVLHVHSLTSSAEDGDFSRKVADNAGIMIGSDPVVLVVKKNSKLLANLLQWVLRVAAVDDAATGRKIIRNVPLLLIDDEADNASINTKKAKAGADDSDSVTAINGRIRELLASFEKSAYVGYTATPFANIFINPEAQTDKHGEDIFPRSFIINVKPPSNYVGPARVFGLAGDPDAGIPGEDALPVVRQVDDYGDPDCFPPGHKKDHRPSRLPGSLRQGIRCFILACAARRARGQERKHNSMLIHVTRFVDVQGQVAQLVRDELLPLQRRLQFGDGDRTPTLVDELRLLWEEEFVPTTLLLGEEAGPIVEWDAVERELNHAAARIRVMPINGYAKEALDYKNHEVEGLSVIAIGGDKLSRGLTLEGLSVSYFLRTSRMYDTLMQMGRWFGYRPGYLDLCRLFTTQQLVEWYRHIALAEVELRREFDYMVETGRTPTDYGLRVRSHPDGMLVTALNKMCWTQELDLSWSGVLVQTTHLPKDQNRIAHNLAATETLLRSLGAPRTEGPQKPCRWDNVSAEKVAEYLANMRYPPASARCAGPQVAEFIRDQASKAPPELTTWTVVMLSKVTAVGEGRVIADQQVGLIERNPESQTGDSYALKKANIKSPRDESFDIENIDASPEVLGGLPMHIRQEIGTLPSQGWTNLAQLALALTRERVRRGVLKGGPDTDVANGRVVREVRPRERGLLLIYPLEQPEHVDLGKNQAKVPTGLVASGPPVIGLALSFPASDTVIGVKYRVGQVWSNAALQDDDAYED